ncbi:hypothetical protein PHISP_04930 [Aspergillus sp. HF37]|nr:hypothetical protein PHISP_04930 [Aspergillus sp. HF37]
MKQLIIGVDATGYRFRGDGTDSNILKIFRMLDSEAICQRCHYQPGFGTYPSSSLLARNPGRVRAWELKARDAAVGSSVAQHVMAAYRFLSGGGYVALLVAEMLDHIGLLGAGNEALIQLAWQLFARWKMRCTSRDTGKREEQYSTMKAFRETFCRPLAQIRFLGLFDAVNSIPCIEVRRNKLQFPYTTCTTAKVLRHAVSIDERRIRFRNELLSDWHPRARSRTAQLHGWLLRHRLHTNREKGCRFSWRDRGKRGAHQIISQECGGPDTLYRPSSRHGTSAEDGDGAEDADQDVDEVWFPGNHPDVGGGMQLSENEDWPLSHVPLVWMVHEAQRAGLTFDLDKLVEFNCADASTLQANNNTTGQHGSEDGINSRFEHALRSASTHSQLHDSLRYRHGVPWPEVLSWRMLEFLPFRRMDLRQDQYWEPVRWPLPRGETRNIPQEANIHASAIRRMEADSMYRPENLVDIEKKSREKVPPKLEVCSHQGCPVRETYRRKY